MDPQRPGGLLLGRARRVISTALLAVSLFSLTAVPAQADPCDICGEGGTIQWVAISESAYNWEDVTYGVKFTVHFVRSIRSVDHLFIQSVRTELWGRPNHPYVPYIRVFGGRNNSDTWTKHPWYTIPSGKTYASYVDQVDLEVEDPEAWFDMSYTHECGSDSCFDGVPSSLPLPDLLPIMMKEYVLESDGYPEFDGGTCQTDAMAAYLCRYKLHVHAEGGSGRPDSPSEMPLPGYTEVNVV